MTTPPFFCPATSIMLSRSKPRTCFELLISTLIVFSLFCSKIRTEPDSSQQVKWHEVSTLLMPDQQLAQKPTQERALRLVVRREPFPFQPNENQPQLFVFVTETLECGHTLDIIPSETEPLIAKRRNCHECSGYYGALRLTPKKSPTSVKSEKKEEAA